MNKARRKQLGEVTAKIKELYELLENIKDEEEEAAGNLPESLQETAQHDAMEDAVENMELALDSLQEAISYIEDAAE